MSDNRPGYKAVREARAQAVAEFADLRASMISRALQKSKERAIREAADEQA